ncbi:MAG TPA: hypothetical protein VHX20_19740 [Terracidiphilus sp.]|jgi:hypothetical protein|nr:hypothetical protein [Terracidiphilus sp.]
MKYFLNLFTAKRADGTPQYHSSINRKPIVPGSRTGTKTFESEAVFKEKLSQVRDEINIEDVMERLGHGEKAQRDNIDLTDAEAASFGWEFPNPKSESDKE